MWIDFSLKTSGMAIVVEIVTRELWSIVKSPTQPNSISTCKVMVVCWELAGLHITQ